ncbi:hypothetical protein [Aquipseudomonas ullengensis]|uniref:Uncharacterized protein n=1 Tax=Aquipseudomonas ullengensis TaxID=2759166 RepID=A0A7W4LI67_9GAMM|nr:hypothetical protein [Pseudomonas ullengensis]MBB2493625.1 hypothetical protein [Pseudomonas ullengensis]
MSTPKPLALTDVLILLLLGATALLPVDQPPSVRHQPERVSVSHSVGASALAMNPTADALTATMSL